MVIFKCESFPSCYILLYRFNNGGQTKPMGSEPAVNISIIILKMSCKTKNTINFNLMIIIAILLYYIIILILFIL